MNNTLQATKANTLNLLRDQLTHAKVLPLSIITIDQYQQNPQQCINSVISQLQPASNFIVRSSSSREDQEQQSNAGRYESVINVKLTELDSAITQVIKSYGCEGDHIKEQILIQPMLERVVKSGVLFTTCPKTAAPYYIINYNNHGDTTAVTSGKQQCYTQYIFHQTKHNISDIFQQLINLADELVSHFRNQYLDIEFGLDDKNHLYLFQVRPLITHNHTKLQLDLSQNLDDIKTFFKTKSARHPYLFGDRTILGVMPDWNPAEIIGIQPKPLALSLYKELITDGTWAYQRDNYGYLNLRSFPLLIDLCGLPYIDIRVSFNSFIPKTLPNDLAEKLVNFYLNKLEEHPYLHDKVEFDIVYSCYTFNTADRLLELTHSNFSQSEIDTIAQSLRELTNSIINQKNGLWQTDAEKVKELESRSHSIMSNNEFDELTKIYWLIQDTKRYGTLPFAGLARAAFIAVQLLHSTVDIGILSHSDKHAFLNSLDTVSSRMTIDFSNFDPDQFLAEYGHLRPGTYDILSDRYDEDPNSYFNWNNNEPLATFDRQEFKLGLAQLKKIEQLLKDHELEYDVVGLFSFMKSAIEGREQLKFIFTKNLSNILSLLKQWGIKHGISADDLAYMDIKDLIKGFSSSHSIYSDIQSSIIQGKHKYDISNRIILPPIIFNEQDIESFELPEVHPNFITQRKINAKTVVYCDETLDFNDAIVFIPSADPGFDWLFTKGIAGLITAYGGVNSHMSIRAAELNIPAVIGAGKVLYEKWSSATRIFLDCEQQHVEILA